jgi:hypothetical protein
MKSHALIAVAVLSSVLLAAFSNPLVGQGADAHPQADSSSDPFERDIGSRINALLDGVSDLRAVEPSLRRTELDAVLNIVSDSMSAAEELDDVSYFIRTYDGMKCDPDREFARGVLKNRLANYSRVLGIRVNHIAGQLSLVRVPAAVQTGERLKDGLRAAQGKLDEISDSLK